VTRDFAGRQRQIAHDFGRAHREALIADWMSQTGETTRPLLKEVAEDFIRDVLGAKLRDEVLPLDRFAQTERVHGRFEVSINSRMAEMERVKDVAGIRLAAEFHETIHIVRDFPTDSGIEVGGQAQLPGLTVARPELVVCRGTRDALDREERARESFAENAGTAAAICREDLIRCPEYLEFLELMSRGGEPGKYGWKLLYAVARFIGVNGSLLAKFWQQQGIMELGAGGRILAQPTLRLGGEFG
jgi:hypothetical protein